jgi:uncharacterized protein YndB with AHSA1/START domain
MRISLLTLSLLLASHCSTAYGEVIDSADNGFSLKHKVTIKATPEKVYETITKPSLWWNPSHTWSGKSENLSIETTPGGLFVEKLPSGGFVRHMEVVYADPGKLLRLHGALGPLQQTACHGAMTFTLTTEKERRDGCGSHVQRLRVCLRRIKVVVSTCKSGDCRTGRSTQTGC